jgi:hypothetical protein
MAEPTPYRPTYGNKAQQGPGAFVNTYYLPNGTTAWEVGLDKQIAVATGYTYTAPLLRAPEGIYRTPASVRYGITGSRFAINDLTFLQNLPYFKRLLQPIWLNNMAELPFNFLSDSINAPYGSTITLYNDDWTTTTSSTKSFAIWPEIGITRTIEYLSQFSTYASQVGATIYAVFGDAEGGLNWTTQAKRDAIAGHTNYSLSWNGLSAFKEIYEYYGGTTGLTFSTYNTNALTIARERYRTRSQTLSWYEAFKLGNSEVTVSNYDDFAKYIPPGGVPSVPLNSINEDGAYEIMTDPVGNASAPTCYFYIRQWDYLTTDINRISVSNPTRFAFESDPDYWASQYPQKGPWPSFMVYYGLLRESRRNRPDLPLTPWIVDVNSAFFNQYRNLEYTLSNQSPPDVIHNTWYRENLESEISNYQGYTAYDGTTSAARVITAPLPVTGGISGIWYGYNIAGVTYDGSTSSFKITTLGNTGITAAGITAAVALYYSGIANGITYIFSYDIDLSRGLTTSLARFTRGWATTNGITLAPERPTTTSTFSGVDFTQIAPIGGATYNLLGPIGYSSGSSGWTTVSWRFVGTSVSTNMGLHIYYGRNPTGSTSGYDIFVRNPSLTIESGSIPVSIVPIDNEYTPSTAFSSLKYFYNGLTAGITYVFSYYIDASRGFTQTNFKLPNAQQTIEHFQAWDYPNTSRGITFRQILPVTTNYSFNTSGISYGSNTGWTKVSWEFVVNNKSVKEPYINTTLSATIYSTNNFYSLTNPNSSITGYFGFVGSPTLEYDSGSGLTSAVQVREIDSMYRRRRLVWDWAPANSLSTCKHGFDERAGFFARDRGGNSAYYYDFIRHACLLGAKSFGLFNTAMFADYTVPGTYEADFPRSDENTEVIYGLYARAGRNDYLQVLTDLNNCLEDVHQKIKGFTLTTADTSELNWLAPYVASGAPGPNGITWWWRLTVKPGYTLYCNGQTLSSNTIPGMWLTTSGSTLAGITITTEKWPNPFVEPTSVGNPIKDFDFVGMTGLASLTAAGFTFTRNSTATFINSSGLVEIAPVGQPRFGYNPNTLTPRGLMIEPSRTNVLNWSETFANTGGSNNNWIYLNLSRQIGNTSPSGNTTAIRFIADSSNATLLSNTGGGNLTNGILSFWAKGITGNENFAYTLNNGITWNGITLETNWKRFTSGMLTGNHQVGFLIGNTGNVIEIWGAQLESAGSSPIDAQIAESSYIPTTNTTITRSADVASIPSSNFATWFGVTYGTVIFEHENVIRLRFWNGTTTNRHDYRYNRSSSEIERVKNGFGASIFINSNSYYSLVSPYAPINSPVKIAWTWAPEGTKAGSWRNLSTAVTGWGSAGITTPPLVNSMVLDQSFTSGGYARRIRIWDKVFSDSQLTQMLQGGLENPCLWNPYG